MFEQNHGKPELVRFTTTTTAELPQVDTVKPLGERIREWVDGVRNDARAILIAKRVAFVVTFTTLGFCGGLVYGWIVDPVEWTGATLSTMEADTKTALVQTLGDLTAYDPNNIRFAQVAAHWDVAEISSIACGLAAGSDDENDKARYTYLAYRLMGDDCK